MVAEINMLVPDHECLKSTEIPISICPDGDAFHEKLHNILESILHNDDPK
jgi:hypothetical protein